jgi:hypothetical protein
MSVHSSNTGSAPVPGAAVLLRHNAYQMRETEERTYWRKIDQVLGALQDGCVPCWARGEGAPNGWKSHNPFECPHPIANDKDAFWTDWHPPSFPGYTRTHPRALLGLLPSPGRSSYLSAYPLLI